MTGACYLTAGALNLFWLWAGDKLSVSVQMAIPVLSVFAGLVGVMLRTGKMSVSAARLYRCRAMWVLLCYYICILSVLLFFGGLFGLDRGWGGAVNLQPFYTIRRFLIHYRRTGSLSSLSNLIGNIVILIPMGVLLPVMFRSMRRSWIFLAFAAAVCVGVEYLQWLTCLGVADVDDSILNFAGAVGGYVLTRLCQMVYFYFKGAKP